MASLALRPLAPPDPVPARGPVAPQVPVRFFLPGYEGQHVDLCGDFPDFRVLHPCAPVAGGHALELRLPPGVYRYKFLVDKASWALPAAPGLVEHVEGYANGVVVVDGAAGPVVWAADRRHLRLDGEGALDVRAELVRGHPVPARVRAVAAGEAPAFVEAPVDVVGERGDRVLLQARLPAQGSPPTHVWMEGHEHRVLPVPTVPPGAGAPAWREGLSLYSIFLDRWHRGRGSPPDDRVIDRALPSTPSIFYGGDLHGVREALPWLKELGLGGVLLSPVHTSNTPHRYDAIDPLVVDPRLGGEAAFRALVGRAEELDLKVVVDLSVTHVNHRHAAFLDVLDRQRESRHASWFRLKSFPVRRRDPSTYEHYYRCHDLPWLNLDDEGARGHAFEAARRLVRLGAHGLRLDAMLETPDGFWAELREQVRAERDDVLLLGELVGDHLASFAEERGADVLTDFRVREILLGFLARRDLSGEEAASRLRVARHRAGAFPPSARAAFVDNHDTARFLSLAGDPLRLRQALVLLAFLPETALFTYGSELDLAAYAGEMELDGAWPERLPMPGLPDPGALPPTAEVLRDALQIRLRLREDGAGDLLLCEGDPDRLWMARQGTRYRWDLELTQGVNLPRCANPDDAQLELHGDSGCVLRIARTPVAGAAA